MVRLWRTPSLRGELVDSCIAGRASSAGGWSVSILVQQQGVSATVDGVHRLVAIADYARLITSSEDPCPVRRGSVKGPVATLSERLIEPPRYEEPSELR